MANFMIWGGPVFCSTINQVPWETETKVSCKPLTGDENGKYYNSLVGGELTPLQKLIRAAMGDETPERVGIAGFSAFHNFANKMLANSDDRATISYVHLADSCFDAKNATTPKQGYLAYATEAMSGADKAMIVTTSGVPGVDVTYQNPDGSSFAHKNGHDSFDMVWQAALSASGATETVQESLPDGLPPPVWTKRAGNVIWLSYEQTMTHEQHVKALAVPLMTFFGVPWMKDPSSGVARSVSMKAEEARRNYTVPILVGLGLLAAWLIWRRG